MLSILPLLGLLGVVSLQVLVRPVHHAADFALHTGKMPILCHQVGLLPQVYAESVNATRHQVMAARQSIAASEDIAIVIPGAAQIQQMIATVHSKIGDHLVGTGQIAETTQGQVRVLETMYVSLLQINLARGLEDHQQEPHLKKQSELCVEHQWSKSLSEYAPDQEQGAPVGPIILMMALHNMLRSCCDRDIDLDLGV